MQQALQVFADASGQHTNLDKSSLLPVGDQLPVPLPTEVLGMRVVQQATALGVRFADGVVQPDWDGHLQRVQGPLSKITRMGMSAFGRGMSLSAYGTSRMLYHA
jgi:hypothetical protein